MLAIRTRSAIIEHMFASVVVPTRIRSRDRHHQLLAAEEAPRYDSGHQPGDRARWGDGSREGEEHNNYDGAAPGGDEEALSLAAALAGVAEALDRLAAVDVAGEPDA